MKRSTLIFLAILISVIDIFLEIPLTDTITETVQIILLVLAIR